MQSAASSHPCHKSLAHLEIQEDSEFFRGGPGCAVTELRLAKAPASWNT